MENPGDYLEWHRISINSLLASAFTKPGLSYPQDPLPHSEFCLQWSVLLPIHGTLAFLFPGLSGSATEDENSNVEEANLTKNIHGSIHPEETS